MSTHARVSHDRPPGPYRMRLGRLTARFAVAALIGLMVIGGCPGEPKAGPPAIMIDTFTMVFFVNQGGVRPVKQTVFVGNLGGGKMVYTATTTESWLSVTGGGTINEAPDPETESRSVSGTVKRISDQIDVRVDPNAPVGNHQGQVVFTAHNTDALIKQVTLFVAFTVVSTDTYYVNDSSTAGDVFTTAVGSIFNSGLTTNSPMHTIQRVLLVHNPGPGSRIQVDTGTYLQNRNISLSSARSGISGAPITFVGASRTGVVLQRTFSGNGAYVVDANSASHVRFESMTLKAGNRAAFLRDSSNITFVDCLFTGAVADGIRAVRGGDIILDNCQMDGNGGPGASFFFVGSPGAVDVRDSTASNNGAYGLFVSSCPTVLLRRNTLFGQDVGIRLEACSSPLVGDCLIRDHNLSGIEVTSATVGATLVNNTLFQNGSREVLISGASTGVQAGNNILFAAGSGSFCLDVAADSQAGFSSNFNNLVPAASALTGAWGAASQVNLAAWQAATAGDANSTEAVPIFLDQTNRDLHQAPGSPTINAGNNTASGLGTTDLDANPRINASTVDLGA
jgi:hypothetical protein